MTILFEQVRIRTAAQAEELPIGTIATSEQDGGGVWRKKSEDSWVKASMKPSLWTNHGMANSDAAITALLPIETAVEHDVGVGYHYSGPYQIFYSRLVTEWREE